VWHERDYAEHNAPAAYEASRSFLQGVSYCLLVAQCVRRVGSVLSNEASVEEGMAVCPYCFHEPQYRFASVVPSPPLLCNTIMGAASLGKVSEKFLLRWASHVHFLSKTATYVQNVKEKHPHETFHE
jgi:hypothetical protein